MNVVLSLILQTKYVLSTLLSTFVWLIYFSICQETEATGQAPGGSEGGEGVTDVIQQLLELSEQVTEETTQPQPPEPSIAMDTAINQDILQVSGRRDHLTINDPPVHTIILVPAGFILVIWGLSCEPEVWLNLGFIPDKTP